MAYATLADLQRLGYLPAEDLAELDGEDADRIPEMLEAESEEFDMYMRPKYGVPLPNSTGFKAIKRAVVRLVVFDLYIMRGFPSILEGSEVAKQIIASAEWAKKLRDDIRDGRAQIDPTLDATPGSPEAGASKGTSPQPSQFTGSYSQTYVGRRSGCC